VPTYEYVCKDCGEHLEVVQSFKDDALTVCPTCDGELKKVFGNIGIVFKGSGFYKTDSRSGSKAATTAAKAEAATKTESSADSASKPDSTTKPDSTSTTKPDSTSTSKPDSSASSSSSGTSSSAAAAS
jgi:putative FmdB family regulatory protein